MIDCFDKEHAFLSNFHSVEVKLDGVIYPSVEHAYQAAKTDDLAKRLEILNCTTAGKAKQMGGRIPYDKAKWSKVKVQVMRDLLEQKFARPDLRALLIATEGHELVEGNYWGDVFWGVYNGKGKNTLGKLLMAIRNGIHMGLD